MASTSNNTSVVRNIDVTLLSFNSIDVRTAQVGDVVVFRTESITHSRDLPLRHGSYARIKGFARSRTGAQQVQVQFKDETIIPLAASNLVQRTPEVDAAAPEARKIIEAVVAHCAEAKRPWLAVPKLQVVLGDLGMYDRLGAQPTAAVEDLPY